jgi:hypothetical protein
VIFLVTEYWPFIVISLAAGVIVGWLFRNPDEPAAEEDEA